MSWRDENDTSSAPARAGVATTDDGGDDGVGDDDDNRHDDAGDDADRHDDADRDRPLAERSRESIEAEIDDLEQSPMRYETREQAVIDRYEGLLAERRRRQQADESEAETGPRQRFRRLCTRLLRALGLR